ncbi:MAG: glycosyltransferase [Candidatus Pacebacteria bacterium]|nr:glycosyltransferase [Candidatus Paceibacterota bacterium]
MISIIIPTFNEERALEATLKDIKKLSSVPYELIVSDSGSTDGTVAIAEQYADRVVRYENMPRNAGRGRNEGAKVATGELLAFVDADVTLVNIDDFFKTAVQEFDQNKRLVAIGARVKTLPEFETWGDKISHMIINFNCFIVNNVFRAAGISGEFQMMRTEAFRKLGGYNEKLNISEDNDLYGRLRKLGQVRLVRRLWVMHESRRAHAIGWMRLWFEWTINLFFVKLFGRTWHPNWKHIR